MSNKTAFRRSLAFLLALVLLSSLTSPAVLAEEAGVITISTPEDLRDLAEHCALDSWSRGKTVLLAADIDLGGGAFAPIPTFGGTFQGQGHAISGLRITAAGSVMGLFRYLQPGGTVEGLTVRGTVAPEGSRATVGGIVGENAGVLKSCSFQGSVRGESAVGGIAGRNTGEITDCKVSGSVRGEKAAGGIAGRNSGLLLRCVNDAGVNLTQPGSEPSFMEDGELMEKIDSAHSLLDGASDSGGIAGQSGGVIQSCENYGDVGYPHVGYNTGGIVGRQNGYLAGCVNAGAIRGRKDVGGIVGQAEPCLLPGEDALEALERELDTLEGLIDRTLDGVGRTGDDVSERLSAMGDFTDGARRSSKDLLDQASGFADSTVETVNTLTADLTGALDRALPALDDLADTGAELETLARELDRALDRLGGAADTGGAAVEGLRDSVAALRRSRDRFQEAVSGMRRTVRTLLSFVAGLPSLPTLEDLRRVREGVTQAFADLRQAKRDLSNALDALQRGLDRSGPLAGQLGDALDEFQDASGSAASLGRLLESAFAIIEDAVEGITQDGPVQFTPLGDAAREAGDHLFDALTGLSGEMEALNGVLQSGRGTLNEDLRAVSRQFRAVLDALSFSELRDGGDGGAIVQDTSEEDIAATREGKAAQCRNRGAVEGDRNVGGIAGAVAVEVDPEDDLTLSLGAAYETKAVLQDCVNQGPVTARKDCAGGIAGRMDLGTVLDCQSYGGVESTGGDYVGGAVGYAGASIRGCWTKNVLSGGRYVGGVAGWASRLRDCRAIATISGGTECLGAVAGWVEEDMSGNRFVDTGWAGVDGVSYAGQAEPVPFEDLAALPGAPAAFTAFTLTLTADGATVAELPFFYGDHLSREDLPPVPEKEGYYGAWPEFDSSGRRSDLTVEAAYTPWVGIVASVETEDGLSLALAEGRFTEDAVLHAGASDQTPPGSGPEARVLEVRLFGTELGEDDTVPIRLLAPEGGKVRQFRDGRWQSVESVSNGRYALLEMQGTVGVFCVEPPEQSPVLGIALAGGGLAVLGLWALRKKRRKKPGAKVPEASEKK